MTKLLWHQEQNRYEFGVDRGVFYSQVDSDKYANGVVWNGLTSVEESPEGGKTASYHFDGNKYLDIVEPRNYSAKLSAYSAPIQASEAIGDKLVVPGFILTRQARIRFGLSYRTFIGEDLGYKIHIVYNILATPKNRDYPTINESVEPSIFTWDINAVPTKSFGYRPSAHYILDSTKIPIEVLQTIESIIYGTDETVPRLPSIGELIDIIIEWNPLLIIPQSLTGLAELVSGSGDLYTTKIDGLNRALPQTRLYKSPIDGLYRLE
jgi:hypothetical protein